ncbi:MAG: DoxX family protein [Pseudomonadota bacterium]
MTNAFAKPDAGIALLRVSLGVMTLAHGLLKLFVFTVPGTVAFFASLGLPAIAAYAVITLEIGGGLLLIAGLGTRFAAAALVPVLIGAAMAHAGNGWLFSNPNGGWEFPAFYAVALIAQTMLGSGAYALDNRVGGLPQPAAA